MRHMDGDIVYTLEQKAIYLYTQSGTKIGDTQSEYANIFFSPAYMSRI